METFLWLLAYVIVTPVVVYISSRAASFGWRSGQKLWDERQQRGQMDLFSKRNQNQTHHGKT